MTSMKSEASNPFAFSKEARALMFSCDSGAFNLELDLNWDGFLRAWFPQDGNPILSEFSEFQTQPELPGNPLTI